jgi:hypothetical protein
MHTDADGCVVHNPLAIKNALQTIAKHHSEKIAGQQNSKYTKHFERGIMPLDSMVFLDPKGERIKASEVEGDTRSVPSTGTPGGGRRVDRTFPIIRDWQAKCAFMVIDPLLCRPKDLDRIKRYLEDIGQLIGIGSFRPENRGYFGRFALDEFKVSDTQ